MGNKMVSLLVISLTLLSCNTSNQKNGRLSPEEMAKAQTERMVSDLNLDEIQSQKVGEINLKYAGLMSEARIKGEINKDDFREFMKSLNIEKAAELKEILSEEQYIVFQKMEQERRQERMKDGQGRRGED